MNKLFAQSHSANTVFEWVMEEVNTENIDENEHGQIAENDGASKPANNVLLRVEDCLINFSFYVDHNH